MSETKLEERAKSKTRAAAFPRVEALRPKAPGCRSREDRRQRHEGGAVLQPLRLPGENRDHHPGREYEHRTGMLSHGAQRRFVPHQRLLLSGKATEESYHKMERDTERAAEELATAEVDVVAWACTSGSVVLPPKAIEEKIARIANCPAATTITAVVAALKALGVKRVALGTPYVSFINETEIAFLEKSGFEVVSMYGLELGENQEERRGIGRVPPQSLHRFARHIDNEKAEAIFISCTNVAGVEEIAAIEAERGKPMITSNLATFWHALRLAGITDQIEGFGRLLAAH